MTVAQPIERPAQRVEEEVEDLHEYARPCLGCIRGRPYGRRLDCVIDPFERTEKPVRPCEGGAGPPARSSATLAGSRHRTPRVQRTTRSRPDCGQSRAAGSSPGRAVARPEFPRRPGSRCQPSEFLPRAGGHRRRSRRRGLEGRALPSVSCHWAPDARAAEGAAGSTDPLLRRHRRRRSAGGDARPQAHGARNPRNTLRRSPRLPGNTIRRR